MAEQGTDGWRDAGFTGPGCVLFEGTTDAQALRRQVVVGRLEEQRPGGWADAGFTGPDCAAFAAA